jgi:hypothetical protein
MNQKPIFLLGTVPAGRVTRPDRNHARAQNLMMINPATCLQQVCGDFIA